MRSNPVFSAFNAGELSPRLHGRTDFSKYKAGLEIGENVVPLPEGGLMRRAGTRYVAELKSSTVLGWLKRFEFSESQAFVVEMGANAFRFYRFQAQIVAANITGSISNGTFGSDLTGWTDVDTGGTAASSWNSAGYMALLGDGTEYAWREQAVASITSGAAYTLKFRVIGAPGDEVLLTVGTSSTGSETVDDKAFKVGYHTYTFTAGATTIYIGFRNNVAKTIGVDDVSFIDNSAIELQTPYAAADLPTIFGPQSADVLYLFHASYPTYKLERLANNSWSLVEVAWQDGPWLAENTTSTTLTFGAATGRGVTVTASAVTGINDNEGFKATDVGRLIRMTDNATVNWGWAVITAWTSSTVVTVDVKRSVVVTTAETKWRLGAWSETTGYPSCAAFFEQRLFAASTTEQPATLWASQSADFENHSPDSPNSSGVWNATVEDDDALDYTISADQVQKIVWMSPGEDTLAIGTASGEWTPASTGAVLTPSDITIRQQTNHGSAAIAPLRVDHVVLLVQKAKRKIQEFGFSFDVNGYRAFDMTRLAQHVTKGGVAQMDYAEEPNSQVFAVRDDGQMPTMTYRREEDVVGWARNVIGGSFYGTITKVWQADDSAGTFVDETTDANSAANADWTVFPASEAVGDYVAIGHTERFAKVVFDYANGTAGIAGAVTWEYWNGSDWTALSGVSDATSGFTTAAADDLAVTWTKPTDWKRRVLSSGKSLYYARARITTVYTTNPVLDQGYIPGKAVVESVVVIPGADGTGSGQVQDSTDRDEVWVTVKRTIDGATKRYIEVFERDYETGDDQEDAYYLDSMVTYDGAATTTITGLDHLEGEKVGVLADGAILPDETVSSGSITIDTSSSVVQVGLRYAHKIKTLKFEGGTAVGTAIGNPKQIFGVTFVVLNAATVSFGPDADHLKTIDFRDVADAMDAAAPFFSGEHYAEFEGDWETDTRIYIESDDPVPFTVLDLAPRIDIKEVI